MYHSALTVTVERSLVLNVVYERRQPITFNVYFWRIVLDVARWPEEIIGLTRFFLSLVSQFARGVRSERCQREWPITYFLFF